MSHLFFADDSLLFCRANQQDSNTILEILHQYEKASGQQINREKTQLFFSPNTDHAMQEHIKSKIGVSATHHIESYLGLPTFVGRGKKKASVTYENGFGIRFKDGRKNCCHKGVGKS